LDAGRGSRIVVSETKPRFFLISGTPDTIDVMQLAVFGMRVLEVMFFVGLAGSAIVVLISFVEDAKELFGED
jgi:hypothetical protein